MVLCDMRFLLYKHFFSKPCTYLFTFVSIHPEENKRKTADVTYKHNFSAYNMLVKHQAGACYGKAYYKVNKNV